MRPLGTEFDPDRFIQQVNHDELIRRRQVNGADLNAWHNDLRMMKDLGDYTRALELLHTIIDTVEDLAFLDPREPQLYWYTQAAWLHERRHEYAQAAEVLERWLAGWPPHRAIPWRQRPRIDRDRDKVTHRVQRLRRRVSTFQDPSPGPC